MYISVVLANGETLMFLDVTELEKALWIYTSLTYEQIQNLCLRLENSEEKSWDVGVIPRNATAMFW